MFNYVFENFEENVEGIDCRTVKCKVVGKHQCRDYCSDNDRRSCDCTFLPRETQDREGCEQDVVAGEKFPMSTAQCTRGYSSERDVEKK